MQVGPQYEQFAGDGVVIGRQRCKMLATFCMIVLTITRSLLAALFGMLTAAITPLHQVATSWLLPADLSISSSLAMFPRSGVDGARCSRAIRCSTRMNDVISRSTYAGLFTHAAFSIISVPNSCDGELVVILCPAHTKKGKVFPYSLPSVGPGPDPGVQAVSPQVT